MLARLSHRSNGDWIAALRGDGPADATLELIVYLRRVVTRSARGRLAPEDIEEVVHDGLGRIVAGLASFRGRSGFATWASAVTLRALADEFRRRQRRAEALGDLTELVADVDGCAPDERLSQTDVLETLERAIAGSLSERQRLAIVAKLRGEPVAAIAERLGTTPNALYKLTHDAHRKLRRALSEAGITVDCIGVWRVGVLP